MDQQTLTELFAGNGLQQMVERHEQERKDRMRDFHDRLLIDNEGHLGEIKSRIGRIYNTDRVIREIQSFATVMINPQKRLTDRVAVAYKHQPVRRLSGQGETVNDAWSQVTRDEARIHKHSKKWGRYAFVLNVVHVLPKVVNTRRGLELRYSLILPHTSSVIPLKHDEDRPAVFMYDLTDFREIEDERPVYAVVGPDGWTTINRNGVPTRTDDAPAGFNEWDLGICPAIPFRTETPPPGDYWHRFRGSGVRDLSIESGRIAAAMSWMRKSQSGKILATVAPEEAIAEGSSAHPESGLDSYALPEEVRIEVLNMETGIDEFAKELRFIYEQVAEGYGVPVTTVDRPGGVEQEPGSAEGNAASEYAALSEVRDAQVETLGDAERDLAEATALVLAEGGHPASTELPAEMVRESFEISYAPLTFTDHPRIRMRVHEDMLKLGLLSPAEVMQRENPGLSLEEARRRIRENDKQRAERNRYLAQHGVADRPMSQGDSEPQRDGRMGGRPRNDADDDVGVDVTQIVA